MPFYVLIPFSAFALCCILQFWFVKKVRDALIERHPQTFLSIEKSSFFPFQGLWRFTLGSAHKALADGDLECQIRNLRRLYAVGLFAWLVYGIALFTAPMS